MDYETEITKLNRGPMAPLPPLHHQGRTYSATYGLQSGFVVVVHGHATKKAIAGGLPVLPLAQQLLFELVVVEGKGVADRQDPP